MNHRKISMEFDQSIGIRHINDIDNLALPYNIAETAKKTLTEEINLKIDQMTVNKLYMCMIPLGMIVFMVGGFMAAFIFPYNFIIVFCGMVLFMGFPIYICTVKNRKQKMLRYTQNVVESRTHGIIRIEYQYGVSYHVNNNMVNKNKYLTRVDAIVIEARLAMYEQSNPNNYNNMNQVRGPIHNPMYPSDFPPQMQPAPFGNNQYPLNYPQNGQGYQNQQMYNKNICDQIDKNFNDPNINTRLL